MKQTIAERFGQYLDADNFQEAIKLLAENCQYNIGAETLVGPEKIVKSYEDNMIEGRKKLDELIWGKSWVDQISDEEFIINFTDYLKHQGESHIHRCQQKIWIDDDNRIKMIVHLKNEEEETKLADFYVRVGLK